MLKRDAVAQRDMRFLLSCGSRCNTLDYNLTYLTQVAYLPQVFLRDFFGT